MYDVKKNAQKITKKLQKGFFAYIILQWGRWSKQKKWILALVLLGVTMFKYILELPHMVTLQGETVCTSYRIQYFDSRWGRNHQEEIEALLVRLYQALSTSLPDSELSRFNEHDCSDFYFESPFLYPVFAKSKEIFRNTAGAFDPTIFPLVHDWNDRLTDTTDLDSLQRNPRCAYVGLDYIVANTQRLKKLKEGVKLDFGGLFKGYVADRIADLLRTYGIKHMWITLENEAVAYGSHVWHTDIHPHVTSLVDTELQIAIALVNQAVAISNRQERSSPHHHCIIDPATGNPAQHTLLAAVVVSDSGMVADAYATAMMVRGFAFAQELLSQQEDLAAFLIYENEQGVPVFYTSPNLCMKQDGHTITLRHAKRSS